MESLITKAEIADHVYASNCIIGKSLLAMLDELHQSEVIERSCTGYFTYEKICFHFKDERGVLLFIVQRVSRQLIVEKVFDAPKINQEEFHNILPLNPYKYHTFRKYPEIETKLFYEDSIRVFKVPLCELLNSSQGFKSKDIYSLNYYDIEDFKIDLLPEKDEAEIIINMDKYSGNHHNYYGINSHYNIRLSDFKILDVQNGHRMYRY